MYRAFCRKSKRDVESKIVSNSRPSSVIKLRERIEGIEGMSGNEGMKECSFEGMSGKMT